MSDKKYSPKDAALAVLKKAEELYKASPLSKGDWAKIHSKLKREGYSEESADKIDGAIKAKMGKAEAPMQKMGMSEENPDEKADAKLGEHIEQEVQEHESQNEDSEHHEAPMKGHIKLAKFVGRMEHKKGLKAKEMDKSDRSRQFQGQKTGPEGYPKYQEQAQNEKGVNTPVSGVTAFPEAKGTSSAGAAVRNGDVAGAKNEHKQVLNQIHQMTKPKLGKGM